MKWWTKSLWLCKIVSPNYVLLFFGLSDPRTVLYEPPRQHFGLILWRLAKYWRSAKKRFFETRGRTCLTDLVLIQTKLALVRPGPKSLTVVKHVWQLVTFTYRRKPQTIVSLCTTESLPFGRGSRVTSRWSRVTSRGSRVSGRGSRVTSRGSKNSSQLFLNVGKSKFRVYSSFRFLFVFLACFRLSLVWTGYHLFFSRVIPGYPVVDSDS